MRSSILWLKISIRPVVLQMATIMVCSAVAGSGAGEIRADLMVAGKNGSWVLSRDEGVVFSKRPNDGGSGSLAGAFSARRFAAASGLITEVWV